MLALQGAVRTVIIMFIASVTIVAGPQRAGAERGEDGGVVTGIGFGTSWLAGDLDRRFAPGPVAVAMRAGLRHKGLGAELNLNIVTLENRGDSSTEWNATTYGPAVAYYLHWRTFAMFVRGGLSLGSISGPEYTEQVPCEGAEDCLFKDVTIRPSYPTIAVEASVGAQVHLARRNHGPHPMLWMTWTVRGMRSLDGEQRLSGRVQQLAIGAAYGILF